MKFTGSFSVAAWSGMVAVTIFSGGLCSAQTATLKLQNEFVVIPGQGVLLDNVYAPGVSLDRKDGGDICNACPKCCKSEKLTHPDFVKKYTPGRLDVATDALDVQGGVVLKKQNLLVPKAQFKAGGSREIKAWDGTLEIKSIDLKAAKPS